MQNRFRPLISFIILALGISCKSPVEQAEELGRMPVDTDTSMYMRVYENKAGEIFINGHLADSIQLESRMLQLKKDQGLVYYCDPYGRDTISKASRIHSLLGKTQIGFIIYRDSSFIKRY